eukprot:COSAG01_NODE_45_length_32100_cov_28.037218_9_plen_110_part_00
MYRPCRDVRCWPRRRYHTRREWRYRLRSISTATGRHSALTKEHVYVLRSRIGAMITQVPTEASLTTDDGITQSSCFTFYMELLAAAAAAPDPAPAGACVPAATKNPPVE